jgi:hypothetical protein
MRAGSNEHVERATTCHPVDCRDDRLPKIGGLWAKQQPGIVHHPGSAGLRNHISSVDASAERLVTGTGEHDGADLVVEAQVAPEAVQLACEHDIERIELIRSVQRDGRNAVGHVVAERLEGAHVDTVFRGSRCSPWSTAVACAVGDATRRHSSS